MKKFIFFYLLLAVLSCKNDDLDELQNSTQETTEESSAAPLDFGTTVQADFMGRIVNDEGFRINNATVSIGDQTVQTDANGVFSIQSASVFENFALVKVTKDSYINGSRAIVPQVNGVNSVEITLLRKNIVETVNSGQSSQVTYENSTVFFPGEFEYPDGTPYNGQVDVSVHYLKPNLSETFNSMPGMLLGEDANGNAQSMETYGMLAINLFDQAGEELDIAEGFPATLEFPVDPDQAAIAPNEIPLWYFDEEMGYWKQEGSAQKQGDKYVGEVSHFTWWNCDLPLDYVTLCLNLIANEQALSGNYIRLTRNETGQTIFYGTVDLNGSECGLIPANESITLNIYGNSIGCQDQIIFQETIGPFSTDTTIDLVIPPDNVDTALITGTILNCDNTPLQEGAAIIFDGSNDFVAGPIPVIDGVLSYQFSYCADLNYQIRIYDSTTINVSDFISVDVNQNEILLGNIPLCGEQSLIYEGDLILDSQEAINEFGLFGYIEINGSFIINDAEDYDIVSLQPLSTIEKVHDIFRITNNKGLESLQGLNNLTTTSSFSITLNEVLNSFEGLEGLSFTSGEAFVIQDNNSLISLDGLENLNHTASTFIALNSQLEDFCALENLIVNGEYNSFSPVGNAYNPTVQDIIDGNCSL